MLGIFFLNSHQNSFQIQFEQVYTMRCLGIVVVFVAVSVVTEGYAASGKYITCSYSTSRALFCHHVSVFCIVHFHVLDSM